MSGTANGVKNPEVLIDLILTIPLYHGFPQAILHLLCFTSEHGRLIGHPYGFEVHIWIKPLRVSPLELLEESSLISAAQDVITY